jgi:hypothetical protein
MIPAKEIDGELWIKASDHHRAIAELESQEPVKLPCCGYTDASAVKWNPFNRVVQCHNCGQGYTTPPAAPQRTWVGLTDEEISACDPSEECWGLLKIARAIEAKLKEKNL